MTEVSGERLGLLMEEPLYANSAAPFASAVTQRAASANASQPDPPAPAGASKQFAAAVLPQHAAAQEARLTVAQMPEIEAALAQVVSPAVKAAEPRVAPGFPWSRRALGLQSSRAAQLAPPHAPLDRRSRPASARSLSPAARAPRFATSAAESVPPPSGRHPPARMPRSPQLV